MRARGGPQATKGGNNEVASPKEGGLRLVASVRAGIKAGQGVGLRVRLENAGTNKAMVSLQRGGPLPQVQLELLDKGGARVPLTAYGKKTFEPTDLSDVAKAIFRSMTLLSVPPGKTLDLSVPNVALFFDLTVPGEYLLKMKRLVVIGDFNSGKVVELRLELKLLIDNPETDSAGADFKK